jgi:hypothetical protein
MGVAGDGGIAVTGVGGGKEVGGERGVRGEFVCKEAECLFFDVVGVGGDEGWGVAEGAALLFFINGATVEEAGGVGACSFVGGPGGGDVGAPFGGFEGGEVFMDFMLV